jgi:hypothetical protein
VDRCALQAVLHEGFDRNGVTDLVVLAEAWTSSSVGYTQEFPVLRSAFGV